MKKILVCLTILPLVLVLSACSLFVKDKNEGKGAGSQEETKATITIDTTENGGIGGNELTGINIFAIYTDLLLGQQLVTPVIENDIIVYKVTLNSPIHIYLKTGNNVAVNSTNNENIVVKVNDTVIQPNGEWENTSNSKTYSKYTTLVTESNTTIKLIKTEA